MDQLASTEDQTVPRPETNSGDLAGQGGGGGRGGQGHRPGQRRHRGVGRGGEGLGGVSPGDGQQEDQADRAPPPSQILRQLCNQRGGQIRKEFPKIKNLLILEH